MKKVLSFLLVAVLAVSAFAGCTQAPANNSTGTESQATSQADSKADSTTDSQASTSQPEASQPAETSTTPTEESSQDATPVEGAGQYVYKDSVSTLASNWNPHTYQTTDDAYPADFIRVGLYGFIFNDESHPVEGKDPYAGYVIIPEMAASLPVDVTEQVRAEHPEFNIPESVSTGYAYTIELNPNAVWEDGTPITADTYVYSMQQLLRSDLKNYRATDYYAQDFCIAGAEAYANSGLSIYKDNSGDAVIYEVADLVLNADGQYETPDGELVYINLTNENTYLGGKTLADYAQYFPEGVYDALAALANEEGYIPANDEAFDLLKQFITSDNWGNEPEEFVAQYLSFYTTYPEVSFDTVGLYKNNDYSITLVLGKSLSGFYLLYNLTGNWIVYQPYYDACLSQDGDAWSSTYNTSVETTMSYGPYKLTEYQSSKYMKFERNENWYGYTDGQHTYVDPEDGETYDMYMTDVIDCQVVEEAATRKLMFLKGELMTYGLQSEDFATYRNSDYVHVTPSETIYFLIVNGYKDAIDGREANEGFDQTKYDLQTLTLKSFKQALAVTYDKELFCTTVSPARSGGYGIIGEMYIYDPDNGSKYRDTDQAKQALCNFYSVDTTQYPDLDAAVASITGYDPEAAKALFQQAFDEALAAGYITDADNDGVSDQIIRMEYSLSSDSDFMTRTINYLNEKVAEVTVGTPFEGKILFEKSAPYGNDWSNKIRAGLADCVLAGWSGSALNPFSLTDLYVNPNNAYDGNWFNGNSVSAKMTIDGVELEMTLKQWSDALNGTTVTVNGVEYNFGDGQVDVETRLSILAMCEEMILQSYDYIPMMQNASMALLTMQAYYVVEEYNPIMGRGGIAYLKYNYDEAEWAEFVASQNGELSY